MLTQEQNAYKHLINLFVSHDFDSLNPSHFKHLESIVQIINNVRKSSAHIKLTTGNDIFTKENFPQNFQANFGIPFNSSNLRNMRLNQLSQSEFILFIQTSDICDFSTFELGYNLNHQSGDILPMFFCVHNSVKTNTSPLKDLPQIYPDLPIKIIRFDQVTEIESPFSSWIDDCIAFKLKNQPKMGSHVNVNTYENENEIEEKIRIGQMRENNINLFGSKFSERWDEKFNIKKEENFDLYKKATLFLKSGKKMKGFSFGANISRAGEAVFHTSMIGYPECLTDPSYRGQILICSSVILGQYGVPEKKRDRYGLLERFESEDIHINGLVITD